MVKFEDELIKYGKLALATNKKMILIPQVRERDREIRWSIHLQSKVSEGVEDLQDFDDFLE